MVNEYLADVRSYMAGVPENEREELLQFYEEQMMDAGLTSEQIIEKYGTPKEFARKLRLEYFIQVDDAPEATDMPVGKRTKNRATLIWLIILGLFASPVLVPVALGLIAALFGVFVAFISVIFAIYATIIAALAVGVFSFISGIILLFQSVATGIFFMGVGIVATAATIFFAPLVWRATKWLFEQVIVFAKWIGRKLVRKNRVEPAQEV